MRRQGACSALLGTGIHRSSRPVKRRGNRRYYQHHEVLLIRRIRELLYEEGFTISGARQRLEHDAEAVPESAPASVGAALDVGKLRAEITAILKILG